MEGTTDYIPLQVGRKSILSMTEKQVLGGWCLERLAQMKAVTQDMVCHRVWKMFGVSVSASWVTQTMHQLGFTSHRTQTTQLQRGSPTTIAEITGFLRKVRARIADTYTPERVVAMDVICFWNTGAVLRSYGLKGG